MGAEPARWAPSMASRITRTEGPAAPDGHRWVRITPPGPRKSRRTARGLLMALMRASTAKGVRRALELDLEARGRGSVGPQVAPPAPARSARARATVSEFFAYCDEL